MNVTVKTSPPDPTGFKPFDLVLSFENREEAMRFHHLFNTTFIVNVTKINDSQIRRKIEEGLGNLHLYDIHGWDEFNSALKAGYRIAFPSEFK